MNENVKSVQISGIRKFYNEVVKVKDAISLTLGQPDFNTPNCIKEEMKKAIDEDKTTYTPNAGIIQLREEISKYLKTLNINYSKEDICITVGGSEGLYSVFQSLVNPGENVLIPTPAYPAYESIVKIIGGKVFNYKLNEDFSLNIEEIERSLDESNSKILVLSFPTNPTGAILDKEGRDKLIKLIKDREIIVITDEIYASIIYDDYYSIAQEDEILDKVIYISGFSKMFSATGLRIGYVCAKKDLMNEIMKVHQYGVSCATSIVQYGMISGLKNGVSEVEKMKQEFKNRRDFVCERLTKMGLEHTVPKGAFYVFPSIKKFNLSSYEFCMKLLNEEKVACVPGEAFGEGGEGYIRISYCYSIEELKLALDKIEDFIKRL
ncbi:pyridoxal phosphate-dependent aminotransferase [Clostridium thermobutyricum]|uniref:Aminotransferase n=1 Tax=Clostridium thermobutyricum DSM 4928 TaxID=1121339 RepID=A0A1V4SVG8_9CLOT|nr:aminotransferase class I/II-fold pyridoxal phosphate-dependent enzyme [Clostridium thermobutyricum]OPX47995.1 putative N-acetyl-LL-diaminopimelate aminotransferase [Clostridium thermobutyricum DSM 4928]